MSSTFAVHKAMFLACWSCIVENYTTRKSEEKLDFLEKTVLWMSKHVASFRQQANVRSNKRRRLMDDDEKEEGENSTVHLSRRQSVQQNSSETHRQRSTSTKSVATSTTLDQHAPRSLQGDGIRHHDDSSQQTSAVKPVAVAIDQSVVTGSPQGNGSPQTLTQPLQHTVRSTPSQIQDVTASGRTQVRQDPSDQIDNQAQDPNPPTQQSDQSR